MNMAQVSASLILLKRNISRVFFHPVFLTINIYKRNSHSQHGPRGQFKSDSPIRHVAFDCTSFLLSRFPHVHTHTASEVSGAPSTGIKDGPARAWEDMGKLRAADERASKKKKGSEGGHGARNRRERLVVGRSVEARSREPDELSLESRVFHDESAAITTGR